MKKSRLYRIKMIVIASILILIGLMIVGVAEGANNGHSVGVYVTNENKVPLENAQVTIKGNDFQEVGTTNKRGGYVFTLQEGPYNLEVEHNDYKSKNKDIYVTGPTTFTMSLEKDVVDQTLLNQYIWAIIGFSILFLIIIFLYFKGARRKKKGGKGGGVFALIIIAILLLAMAFNCGCIGNLQDSKTDKTDDNPLYCGEDKWFSTTLDYEVVSESYNSRIEEVNKATQKLYSDYIIQITPLDPSPDSDANGDGVPDGYMTDTGFAHSYDGIGESPPQACNGIGYEGKLYNGVSMSMTSYSEDIQPQSNIRAGISVESQKGTIDQLFITDLDRPFLKLKQNFKDDFVEEEIYITVPIIVEILIEGKLTGREIYSSEIDCPVIIHIPPPGQDAIMTEYLSLELLVPLDFIGGGLVKVKSKGSEIGGYAWVNVRTSSDELEDALEEYEEAKKRREYLIYKLKKLREARENWWWNPIAALASIVFSAFWLLDAVEDVLELPPLPEYPGRFEPGVGWYFDKGRLNGLKEYHYNVYPEATEPIEGGN